MATAPYNFIKLRKYILHVLSTQLSDRLTYHGYHHTIDVMNVCRQYLRRNKIKGYEAHILKLAAAFHDLGFTRTYRNHEEMGVRMAQKLMNENGFLQSEFKRIEGLILATKVPQSPSNELEYILCDADLDYLGRDDFTPISHSLFIELRNHNLVHSLREWNEIQLKFLTAHSYHTDFARKYRQKKKEIQIEHIKQLVGAGH